MTLMGFVRGSASTCMPGAAPRHDHLTGRTTVAIFAIHYTYPDDRTEMLTIRPEHREWLSGLHGLLVAGHVPAEGIDEVSEGEPTDQEPANAALIVVLAESLGEVSQTFDHDPYWLGGHVLRRVVRAWDPPLGPWVADATQSPG